MPYPCAFFTRVLEDIFLFSTCYEVVNFRSKEPKDFFFLLRSSCSALMTSCISTFAPISFWCLEHPEEQTKLTYKYFGPKERKLFLEYYLSRRKAVARATGFATESVNLWSNRLSCKEADLL